MLRDEGVVVESSWSSWSVMDAVARTGSFSRASESRIGDARATKEHEAADVRENNREAADVREEHRETADVREDDRKAAGSHEAAVFREDHREAAGSREAVDVRENCREAAGSPEAIADRQDYREIDRQLRRIAKRKAGLDIEEARWLREAEKHRMWRKLGYSTALEYLEDVFGYSPRTAMDRLRVAKELGQLPALEAAVREGELPYTAARELTRVMTPETESAWLASARGKNLRDIEELVAGRKKGDTPDTEKNPALIHRKRMLELSPRVDAMFEQCRGVMANELGSHVDDEMLVEGLCRCFLTGGGVQEIPCEGESSPGQDGSLAAVAQAANGANAAKGGAAAKDADAAKGAIVAKGGAAATEADAAKGANAVHHQGKAKAKAKAPRPAHRIIIYKCEHCDRAWQQGRGRTVELTPAELALAECDGETVRWTDVSPQEPIPDNEPVPVLESCPQEADPDSEPQPTLASWPRAELLANEPASSKDKKRSRSKREKRSAPNTPQQVPPNASPPLMPRIQQRITPNLSQRATPNIPQRIRNLVWARDKGRCRVPGCRSTRCLDIHHIRPRCEGGDHDLANLVVLCSGHHKLLHAGLLTITGRAPDQLVFIRNGKVLVDARSPAQANASEELRERTASSKLEDVARREHAKQALVELGYKKRAAASAVDEVLAHMGPNADVGTIVKAALARGAASPPADNEDPIELARQALVQLGFSSPMAKTAVERATAHVGTELELPALIKEALRWCR